MSEQSLPAYVGQRVREIRDAAGCTQDELAAAARRVGLDWVQAAVASLETGRRGLSAEELLRLPLALHQLPGRPVVGVGDLIPPLYPDKPRTIPVDSRREAERHVAKVLGWSTPLVDQAANRMWGRGLTEERERRLGKQGTQNGSLKAMRGHVTRTLIEELREGYAELADEDLAIAERATDAKG